MFENLNGWEVIVLALLGLFIFGPERLPKVIGDAMRTIRNLRDMARNATDDLSREMGTDVRLEDLHPKTFIRKHLLSEEDERELRRPFNDMYEDVRQISSEATDIGRAATAPAPRTYEPPNGNPPKVSGPSNGTGPTKGSAPAAGQPDQPDNRPGAHRYDADAT
jgi:sec-independent protein translocase protein TatB